MGDTANKLAIRGGTPIRKESASIWPPNGLWPIFDQRERDAILSVLDSGAWCRLNGSQASEFETEFAQFTGSAHAIAVANGTVSLQLALLAIGIEAGDEVIVPPFTFIATASSVINVNGVPIFADVDPETYNLDPAQIEQAITPRTRAIIPVHMSGMAADMDAILAIARKHGLVVIEDAAHAHGGRYQGKSLGALGDIGSFSFQQTKNCTAGEGGAILTDNTRYFELMDSIQNFGRDVRGSAKRWEHIRLCANYRITEFQSALLRVQLQRLEEQTCRRDANGRYLAEKVAQIPGFTPQAIPAEQKCCPYHIWAFRYDRQVYPVDRAVLIGALKAEGLPVGSLYPLPLYKQSLFGNKAFGPFTGYRQSRPELDYDRFHCPVTEALCEDACMYDHPLLLGDRKQIDDLLRGFQKIHECRDQLVGVNNG